MISSNRRRPIIIGRDVLVDSFVLFLKKGFVIKKIVFLSTIEVLYVLYSGQ